MPAPPAPGRLPWLDGLRAAAALLVLLSHVRDFTLRDAAAQPPLSLLGRAFFALSGLGHQAVIVFFVLSGFLVTRSMRRLADEGHWSLLRFGADRLSRLWLVLIPCLLLGGLLDGIGLALAGQGSGYGALALTAPLPAPAPARDAATLLGNMVFLQTVVVPVYGSNGPLWSLADEAWFYLLAALGFAALQARARPVLAALPCLVAVATLLWLPLSLLALFPVWLCGAACAHPVFETRSRAPAYAIAAGLGFVAVLTASRLRLGSGPLVLDWALGLATAVLLVSIARLSWPDRWWTRPVLRLSAMSYGLYLSHVPVLALLSTILVGPHRRVLDGGSAAILVLDFGVALACAAVLWWAFERHTAALRRLMGRLASGRLLAGVAVAGGTAT